MSKSYYAESLVRQFAWYLEYKYYVPILDIMRSGMSASFVPPPLPKDRNETFLLSSVLLYESFSGTFSFTFCLRSCCEFDCANYAHVRFSARTCSISCIKRSCQCFFKCAYRRSVILHRFDDSVCKLAVFLARTHSFVA